jgi:hypothetical protein
MENTSGQGETADVPQEIIRWNWGAFVLNWIWGIRNKTYIAFLCIIPIFGFVMMIVMGMKGNEWAWQNRHWESVEQFQLEQKIWSKWGIRIGFLLIILAIIGTIVSPILEFFLLLHPKE